MNAPFISFSTETATYSVPNRWQLLSDEMFVPTFDLLEQWSRGELSPAALQSLYVCTALGLDHRKVFKSGGGENLFSISSSVDFLLEYDEKEEAYRMRQPLFTKQFLPRITIAGEELTGYTVCTAGDMLSTDLQSIRFIDALDLLSAGNPIALLRLVLTLYAGSSYSAEEVHRRAEQLADKISEADGLVIRAVAFQFGALASYIFSLPRFALLKNNRQQSEGSQEYAVGLDASLYHLCADGIGSASEVEDMPVLRFLESMRNKLIEGVRSLHDAGVKLLDIEEKTGVPLTIISQIIHA